MVTIELLKTTWYFLMEAFLVICAIFLVLFALYGIIKFLTFMRKNLN